MSKKKIVVITGGSSGIGAAISATLSRQGYAVVNADVNSPKDASEAEHFPCDVSSAQDVANLYQYVLSQYGIPDVLVSNAGQGIHEKIAEGDPEKWARIIDINLMGSLRLLRSFLPDMLRVRGGTVIFISSTAVKQAYPYGGIYAASKTALNVIARTLQLEVEDALRVSVISPGVVDTAFFKNMVSSGHTVEDIGWGSLSAQHVAGLISTILSLPPSVKLPEVTISPIKQPL